MTHRERYVNTVLGQPVDRAPFLLYWNPWPTTEERWNQEGKDPAQAHNARFDVDVAPQVVPVNIGPCPPHAYEVLVEDSDYVTWVDSWGIKRRNPRKTASMSEFIEFPVKSRDDWERYKAERLDPDSPERLAGDWLEKCRAWEAEGVPIQLGYFPDSGVFGGLRWLLGDEECLLAFCTAPDLVRDIMDHLTTVMLAVYEAVASRARVDVIHFWEDMCGRQGPLISPALWEEFMGPNYRRVKALADRHGIPVISVDTDGCPDLIVQPMIDAGVNLLFPNEVAAGCDVTDYRRRFPELGLLGGMDKRVLAQGAEAIDRELERVRPALESGPYIPALDHCVPDDVSWNAYCHYAKALKKMVGKN